MPAATARKSKSKQPPLETPATRPYPYALPLGDGRKFIVELPAAWVAFDPDGEVLFRPAAQRFLERTHSVLVDLPDQPAPGAIRSFREALSMTQKELGDAIDVDKLTISRWERGQVSPRLSAVKAMRKLRARQAKRGVVVGA